MDEEGYGDPSQVDPALGQDITTSESVESFLATLDDTKLSLNPVHMDLGFDHVERMLYRRCFGERGRLPEAYKDCIRFPIGVNTLNDHYDSRAPGKLTVYFSSSKFRFR